MINFTDDEQIAISALADVIIDCLNEALKNETEKWKIMFEGTAKHEILILKSIREKINEERKRQGRREL